jgi:hypothetical protein
VAGCEGENAGGNKVKKELMSIILPILFITYIFTNSYGKSLDTEVRGVNQKTNMLNFTVTGTGIPEKVFGNTHFVAATVTCATVGEKKIKRIIKERNIIKFVDESGKVKKQLLLNENTEKVKVFDKKDKNKSWMGLRKKWAEAKLSDNGKKLIVFENEENELDENTNEQLKFYDDLDRNAKRNIKMVGIDGNVIWSKELDSDRSLGGNEENMQVNNNGIVAILTTEAYAEDGQLILQVFDAAGKVILVLPTKEEKEKHLFCAFGSEFKISGDGKYLGITRSLHGKGTSLYIYNLSNGRWVDLGKDYGIHKIDENGKAYLFSGPEKMVVDLNKEIGN